MHAYTYMQIHTYIFTKSDLPCRPTHVHLPPVMRCISASLYPHLWNQWKLYYPNLLPQFRWGGERYEKALLNSSNKRSNSCWNCDVPLLTSDEEYICRPLCPLGVLYGCSVGTTAFSNGNSGNHLKLRGPMFLFIAFMFAHRSLPMPWQ